MKKNRWALRLTLLLLLAAVLNVTASAAAEVGSASDPLVTLSYLNDTFLSAVLTKVDTKLTARNTALAAQLSAQVTAAEKEIAEKSGTGTSGTAPTFTLVTIAKGKTLTAGVGCEVMLRVGTAVCVASSAPGLIDETTAGSIGGGAALTANHLYMATIDGRGVKATAATVKLLVRGTYTVA